MRNLVSVISPSLQRTNRARSRSLDRPVAATYVSDVDVAERAYEKFLARGSVHGFDRQDWTGAQRELVAEAFEQ
jgi:Protein of unknown function (DUF2934)